MINFKLGSVKFIFKFEFFMSAALFCLIDNVGVALSTFCACIIHEIGHIMASVICNVKIERIIFNFGGIKMLSEGKITGFSKDIFILLCGPAMNFLAAFFYFYMGLYTPFSVNLILGAFNLLPFSALDGGVILQKLFERAEINANIIKAIAILSAVGVCIFLVFADVRNFMIYAVIIFLAVCEIIY